MTAQENNAFKQAYRLYEAFRESSWTPEEWVRFSHAASAACDGDPLMMHLMIGIMDYFDEVSKMQKGAVA